MILKLKVQVKTTMMDHLKVVVIWNIVSIKNPTMYQLSLKPIIKKQNKFRDQRQNKYKQNNK